MISRKDAKESFDIDFKSGAFFTGGKVKWSADGSTLFCNSSGIVNGIDVLSGKPKIALKESEDAEEDVVHCFTITKSGSHAVTSHKSGLFKYWDASDGTLLKCWKSIHIGPVADLDLNSNGYFLASGGSDSIIRIWSLVGHSCIFALREGQGVMSVVRFFETESKNYVFGCGDDTEIKCWDLVDGQLKFKLSGHYSKVTDLSFHYEEKYLVSCGRDKVLILWNLEEKSIVKIIPVFEGLEGVVCLPKKFEIPNLGEIKDGVHVATGGERGLIRVFDFLKGKEIFCQNNSIVSAASEDGGLAITQLLFNALTNSLAVISADHNIILHDLHSFNIKKQLIGFSDEILDIAYLGPENSHLAVASNSADIKLYNISNMGCQILKGHTDLVLTLATCFINSNFMVSGAKDNTVRLWKFNPKKETVKCVFVGSRHTASVSSVCFSQMSQDFFFSASNDTTIKLWTIKNVTKSEDKKKSDYEVSVTRTDVAHQKEINCITVSPNDKIVATASQDKTAKLWLVEDLSLLGTLNGHRRGVWSIRFSPVDKIALTSSADCTIKIWSISDLTCLKTFEGHESSVLRVEFLTRGTQIVSASADGLLKLWDIKSSDCRGTFEGHSGKIWALTVSITEDKFITGGSDSLLIHWRDSTQEKRDAAFKANEELLAQEQHLSNLIKNNQLFAALSLSLSLDRPFQSLSIIKELFKVGKVEGLRITVKNLTDTEKDKLLKCASVWNCNAKNCDAAQLVISIISDELSIGKLKLPNLQTFLEEALPYTERHFKRLTNLVEELHFLEYTTGCMNAATTSK